MGQRLFRLAFALYCATRREAGPLLQQPTVDLAASGVGGRVSRGMRRLLRRMHAPGVETEDRRTLRSRGAMALSEVWTLMDNVHCVLWFDNFMRRRALHQPQQPYHELNCTVVCVLMTGPLLSYPGLPGADRFNQMVLGAAALMRRHWEEMAALVASINAQPVGSGDLRVPLDVPRSGVRSPLWLPLGLHPLQMNVQSDLVELLQYLVGTVSARA